MAKAERGTKRQCLKCGVKFYDLNSDPIVCPSCEAPFEVAALVAAAPVPEKAAVSPKAETDSTEVEVDAAAVAAGAEVVSFEDAEKENDDDDEDEALAEVAGVEEVDDIGGEVSNSFVESDDDDDEEELGIPVVERRNDDE